MRANTLTQIHRNYKYLLELWDILLDSDSDVSSLSKIRGVKSAMLTYEFLFGKYRSFLRSGNTALIISYCNVNFSPIRCLAIGYCMISNSSDLFFDHMYLLFVVL